MEPATMRAMAVDAAAHRLREVRKPVPAPGAQEVLVRVRACGVADERFCFALPEHVDDLHAAPLLSVRTYVQSFALADANAAVDAVRAGRLEGAAVLVP